MHASSLENMWRCYGRYVANGPLEDQAETVVLDVGGADVNGSYREVFARPWFRYIGVDMAPGPGVDIVLSDPYRLPLADASVDIVISGQAFEHCEFFWLLFQEMVRLLRPEGVIFLIAPSAGAIHRYPVDCYRFYPDAYAALAKHAGCVLVESWLDERGPWRDLIGVFRRAQASPLKPGAFLTGQPPAEWSGVPGAPQEEATRGKAPYLQVLERLHRELSPASYLEIGVRRGSSLALARCPAVGVDPAPDIDRELPPTTKIHALTSDEFFSKYADGVSPDLSFIDGLHLFEYALRDFMNVERRAAPGALVIMDDIFPNHPVQAQRERRTRVWTGDVWRLVEALRRYRPDLFLLPLDVSPAGLLLVAGLDPTNRVLWDAYNPAVREVRALDGPPEDVLERQHAVDPASDEVRRVLEAVKRARAERCPPREIVARLRHAQDGDAVHRGPRSPVKPKLSLVVIGYNMARELPRTIRSLSPAMQRDIDPRDYEVIVIDNGSTQAFDEGELRRFLPDLAVHRFQNATVSPAPAINFGLTQARGDLVGVCIDGARMSSPGLLAKALAASRLHERPVIGTIAFHLGSEVQMESVKRGYNQAIEDELLAGSGWEKDGYRLFTISAFAGSSAGGWFELPAESNAFFLRAEHWRAIGGWDEGFVSPGGGMVNLDTWSRVCADPEAEVIMLLGEATFHQVHGGVATNSLNPPQAMFHDEYVRLRGRPYERPSRRPLYFGALTDTMRPSLNFSLNRL
jgi:glycosyltransferase involved in cell wall biosynthesis/SAM-dependent methyltransferase